MNFVQNHRLNYHTSRHHPYSHYSHFSPYHHYNNHYEYENNYLNNNNYNSNNNNNNSNNNNSNNNNNFNNGNTNFFINNNIFNSNLINNDLNLNNNYSNNNRININNNNNNNNNNKNNNNNNNSSNQNQYRPISSSVTSSPLQPLPLSHFNHEEESEKLELLHSDESDGIGGNNFIFVQVNKVKKTRSKKTREHREELELCFRKNPFPDAIEKEIIAYQLDMSVEQIITWFKHKRESLKKANNMEYKEKCVKKFTKTTKELNYFFFNSPFPSKENIEYFAFNYGVSEDKIKIWFKSKRHSLRDTHIFINNQVIPKDNNDDSNDYDKLNSNNKTTQSSPSSSPRQLQPQQPQSQLQSQQSKHYNHTFDSTVYKIDNISELKKSSTQNLNNRSSINNNTLECSTLMDNNKLSISFINN